MACVTPPSRFACSQAVRDRSTSVYSVSSTFSNGPQMITPTSTPAQSRSTSPQRTSPTPYISSSPPRGLCTTISDPASGCVWTKGRTSQYSMDRSEFKEGAILYIRPQEDISPMALQESDVEMGGLGHPCVVIHIFLESFCNPYDGWVQIAQMTSFRGIPLSDKYLEQQRGHLPIFPAPEHPLGLPRLQMQTGCMDKMTYLKVGSSFRVHISMLKPFRGMGPMAKMLTPESLEIARSYVSQTVSLRRSSVSSNGPSSSQTSPALIRRLYDPRHPPPFSFDQVGDSIPGYGVPWRAYALDKQGFPFVYDCVTMGEFPCPPHWYAQYSSMKGQWHTPPRSFPAPVSTNGTSDAAQARMIDLISRSEAASEVLKPRSSKFNASSKPLLSS